MEPDRFYIDPETQDRVRATYRVQLTMPVIHYGYVDVEALSESEASELALTRDLYNVDWMCNEYGDSSAITVSDVECENPPEGTILVTRGYCQCGANLDAIFDRETPGKTGEGISGGV